MVLDGIATYTLFLEEIIKNLTIEQAVDIYQKYYWTFKAPSIPNALDLIQSQPVGGKILDMTVLSGQRTAIKLVQRAANLPENGYFDQGTLDTVNGLGDGFVQALIATWTASLSSIADQKIAAAQAQKVAAEANNDEAAVKEATTLIVYWTRVKLGWLNRAAWTGV